MHERETIASRYDSLRALMIKVDDYSPTVTTRQDGSVIPRVVSVPTDEMFDVMHERNPESIGLMIRLLSTGSIVAQKLAYRSYIQRFHNILDEMDDGAYWVRIGNEGKMLNHDDYARMCWNFGNVSHAADASGGLIHTAQFFSFLDGYADFARHGASDSYWTGLAALACSEFPFYEDSRDTDAARADFIEWASKQDDIGAVVRVSRERQTVIVPVLESVLEDQSRVFPTLTEGVL